MWTKTTGTLRKVTYGCDTRLRKVTEGHRDREEGWNEDGQRGITRIGKKDNEEKKEDGTEEIGHRDIDSD